MSEDIDNIMSEDIDNIMSEDIQAPRLPQSKSYLKIIEILYLMENTNVPINSEFIKNHLLLDQELSRSHPNLIW